MTCVYCEKTIAKYCVSVLGYQHSECSDGFWEWYKSQIPWGEYGCLRNYPIKKYFKIWITTQH